jgi:hypothetical protein
VSDPVPGNVPAELIELAAKAMAERHAENREPFIAEHEEQARAALAAVLPVVRQQIADQERRRFWDDLISIRVTTETGEERYYRVEDVTLIRTAAAEVVRGDL